MEIGDMGSMGEPSAPLTVAVTVNGSKNSKHALKWALEKFILEGKILFKLLYVRPKITMVPTPMGNYLPISQVRDDVASAYRMDIEMQTRSLLQPYTKMCTQRKIEAEAVVIEADDVAQAISEEVNRFHISKLVIGVPSRNIFTRKLSSRMSSRISECIPSFCTIYVVSKGKLSSVHASTSGAVKNVGHESTSTIVPSTSLTRSSMSQTESMNSTKSDFSLSRSSSLSSQLNEAKNLGCLDLSLEFGDKLHDRTPSFSSDGNSGTSCSNLSEVQSVYSAPSSHSNSQSYIHLENSDQTSKSDTMKNSLLPPDEVNVHFEVERLRVELRHLQKVYEFAQDESCDVARQLNEIRAFHEEEALRFSEIRIREEKARELARKETERRKAVEREANYVRECAEKEALYRKDAEDDASREAAEKERLERALTCSEEQYKRYPWDEIESATLSFSDALKIGTGANGTVYKASFRHTVAAVKVLHSNGDREMKQFRQELDILGRIRHPHLLLLLGACPERCCLVYEYMENGSLEDRLQCKNNTPPLPWNYRFRIAWEIASALIFLHNSKPDPIIHRDLKPANILLNRNYVSKIGDVGLSTLVPSLNFAKSTMYMDTAPVGTFFYIDPEYQRTGLLSTKSDTYALGIVILQLLTGKPPMGLAHSVETALEGGSLVDVLDSEAGQWPMEETQELALLGLNCAELRRRDRPDLKHQVLPILQRLKDFSDKAQGFLCYKELR